MSVRIYAIASSFLHPSGTSLMNAMTGFEQFSSEFKTRFQIGF
ncbi:MAG: hypothetical protein AAFX46_06860 [Cyanobacteria bacterium J06636_27]